MRYSLQWLIEQHNQGENLKYVFFWGHQPKKDGSIGESCFSQWWQSAFKVEGIEFKTAEHWMMYQKAKLFGDQKHSEMVLQCNSPAEAKKIGRLVENFDAMRWDEHKYAFVKQGNYHKFSQHPDLKEFLLNTGDRVLVEASPVDNIWGIGMAKTDENIYNPSQWKGENLLGFALMEVREELKW
jgi:ribA/ribD-fused uncharacterized protein